MDIYDVYEQLEKMILTELGSLVTGFGDKPMDEVYSEVFGYIRENPKYFKIVFSPHNSNVLYQKMLKLIVGFKRMVWAESLGVDMTDARVDNAIRYHCNGGFAIIAEWVLNDFDQPQERIAEMLSGFEKSTRSLLEK